MRMEARAKAMRLALVLDDLFNYAREHQNKMNMTNATITKVTPTQRQPLTPERIRELAHINLNRCLKESYEYRLLYGHVSPEQYDHQMDALSYCLSDALERIDSRDIPQRIKDMADNLLDEHGISNPAKAAESTAEQLPYLQLYNQLQRAEAATLESELAGPCWDGSLRKAGDWNVSMFFETEVVFL